MSIMFLFAKRLALAYNNHLITSFNSSQIYILTCPKLRISSNVYAKIYYFQRLDFSKAVADR